MRRPYITPNGLWPPGKVPGPSDLRKLDQYSSELVNGEDGGSWAPTNPLVVGLHLNHSGNPTISMGAATCLVDGDIETVKGNARGAEDDVPGIVLSSGAPVFQSSRSRSIVVPFNLALQFSSTATSTFTDFPDADGPQKFPLPWVVDPATLGMTGRTQISTVQIGPGSDTELTVFLPIKAQHRGATIASVDFRFAIVSPRFALPSTMPKVRVARFSVGQHDGLHTNAGGYDALGWLPDAAGTAAAYYNNGATRTITYTPNQFNTSIDPTTYQYAVQFSAETIALPSTGNTLVFNALVNLTTIADMKRA